MIIFSGCDFCVHMEKKDDHLRVCGAYPHGIPDEVYHNKEFDSSVDCANGYSFKHIRDAEK